MSLAVSGGIKGISITEQVSDLLRNAIVKGDLTPGQRLVEQQLARQFGVGQNAVREALIELAHRGYVRRVANRATYVTSLSFEEARKLAQVRTALEGLAVELVARRQEREALDFKPLRQKLEAMRKAAKAGDRESFYEADLAWHRELWRLSGNEYLAQSAEQIVAPLFAFFIMLYMRAGHDPASFLEAVAAHEKVMNELALAEPELAAAALRNLVDLAVKHQQGLINDRGRAIP